MTGNVLSQSLVCWYNLCFVPLTMSAHQVLTVSCVPNVSSAGGHNLVKVLVIFQMSITGMKKHTDDQLTQG